jgi:hypothetical protein
VVLKHGRSKRAETEPSIFSINDLGRAEPSMANPGFE